jgi:predicted lipid-binding transport protein (Tim44 family)
MTTNTTASTPCDDPSGRNRSSMVARAGVARTFGGLGGFLAIMFLGAGVYLLPLRAQAVGLIAGAFVLALATMMLYFIFSSRPAHRRRKTHRRARSTPQLYVVAVARIEETTATAAALPVQPSTQESTEGLPLPA